MAKKKTDLIPVVAYRRKSTKGQRNGKQKQENSFGQQERELLKLAKSCGYDVIRWYGDEGISGWKQDVKRPDFARMFDDAKGKGDFQGILIDDLDRFTRAPWRKVARDVDVLAEAGVRFIHACKDGKYLIEDEHDPGEAHRLVAMAMANHEFSRKLSRRVTLARTNAAAEGKRTGGHVPYGMADDGKGGLKHGGPKKIKTINWIFLQFANHARSLNWIAGDLNGRKVPGPRGGAWYVKSVALLLRQKAYRGDFVYDGKEQKRKAYKPVVAPALFNKANRRLDTLSKDRTRRKRTGYPLTGVLVCAHCGRGMNGSRQKMQTAGAVTYSPTIYRCTTNGQLGSGACGNRQVRENQILPFILRTLGKEIKDLKTLVSLPPEEINEPYKQRSEQREQTEREREKLTSEIATLVARISKVDEDTFRSLNEMLPRMQADLKLLEAELETDVTHQGFTADELLALDEWWANLYQAAVRMPLSEPPLPDSGLHYESNVAVVENTSDGEVLWGPDGAEVNAEQISLLADPRLVNEALLSLGAEVQLWWETQQYTTSGGVFRNRHILVRGRFRLGQQKGKLPRYVLGTTACRSSARSW
jgi:DNA invertase Pin-like site-specific DNA recombinase